MNKIKDILEQVVVGLGYEFIDYELDNARTIRVYIDKPNGITVGDCEVVSNQLSKVLLVEEINYNRLEISSPGLERPLKKIEHFVKFKNKLVKIKTHEAIENVKVFIGVIIDVNDDKISIDVKENNKNSKSICINFNQIDRARLIFDYKKNKS